MSCCFGGGSAPTTPAGGRPGELSPRPSNPHRSTTLQTTPPPAEMSFTRKPLPPGCKRFTYRELQGATGDFANNAVIGEGGFGKVFRGTLEDGTPVAIKRLDRLGLQGDREFNVEVNTLGRLRHANLVNLLGACTEGQHRLAVFDFMPGGSLRDNLDIKQTGTLGPWEAPRTNLLWPSRLGVALDAARGLAYLHEGTQPGVIHRDIKSSNVLLDGEGRARVADFGLALRTGQCSGAAAASYQTPGTGDPTEMLTGTFGYSAPEYEASGKMSQKCDVYSFGVVLLELLTGRTHVDTQQSRQIASHKLTTDLHPLLVNMDLEGMKERLDPVMPPESVPSLQLAYFIQVAAECLQSTPSERPRMSEVVRFLQKIAALEEGQTIPLSAREGAPRYSLLNLMDAAAQVPPLSGSSGVLMPLPLVYTPWATPATEASASPVQHLPRFGEQAERSLAVPTTPLPAQASGLQAWESPPQIHIRPLEPSHWPTMPLSPSAAERHSRANAHGESAQPPASPGVEPAFLHTLLGEEAQPAGESSRGGLGAAGRAPLTDAGELGGGWTGGAGPSDGWTQFGGPGASAFRTEGGPDPAHLFGPLQMGMEPLLMPHRRPPPPPA